MSFDDLDNHLPLLAIESISQRLSTAPSPIPLVHTRISTSRRRNRPAPYPQPQHSLYQLNITYLVSISSSTDFLNNLHYLKDPVTVQELVEIVRPRVRLFLLTYFFSLFKPQSVSETRPCGCPSASSTRLTSRSVKSERRFEP